MVCGGVGAVTVELEPTITTGALIETDRARRLPISPPAPSLADFASLRYLSIPSWRYWGSCWRLQLGSRSPHQFYNLMRCAARLAASTVPCSPPIFVAPISISATNTCWLQSSVVMDETSVASGKANVPGVWGAAPFLVLLLTMLNTFGLSVGMRLVLTGLIIVGVITAAGGPHTEH